MSIRMPELLSPAGDMESLLAALRFGADAVFLGAKSFGMRAGAANFSAQELKTAVSHARAYGARVHLTCNNIPRNDEIDALPDFLHMVREAGVDALIVADIGILLLAKRLVPDLELHISTQAGIVNYAAAREFYEMGAKRVILARELSLDEIAVIREKTPPELEIEVFVHGAMCMSFSGRCTLSSYMTGRDANRGECAQPCRWSYSLMEEKRPGQHMPVFEDEQGSYILNAKDLCMIGHVDKLIAAGIDSFKIEGRAKSTYYAAAVTHAYRMALDMYNKSPELYRENIPLLLNEADKVSHREYSTGFFFGQPNQNTQTGGYLRSYDIAAVVEDYDGAHLHCTQRNHFKITDELELLEPGKMPAPFHAAALLNANAEPIDAARHPMMALRIPYPRHVERGSILRKKLQD